MKDFKTSTDFEERMEKSKSVSLQALDFATRTTSMLEKSESIKRRESVSLEKSKRKSGGRILNMFFPQSEAK
jgi:hypothetical protein